MDGVDPVSAASSGAAGSLKGSLNVTLPRKFRFVFREGRGKDILVAEDGRAALHDTEVCVPEAKARPVQRVAMEPCCAWRRKGDRSGMREGSERGTGEERAGMSGGLCL